jgi:hypothetical protein
MTVIANQSNQWSAKHREELVVVTTSRAVRIVCGQSSIATLFRAVRESAVTSLMVVGGEAIYCIELDSRI